MSDLLNDAITDRDGPVECLGKNFPSDRARREYFIQLLANKLKDPVFRATEGFPRGTDEKILAMSDPPYFTACPNPFLPDFIAHYGKSYEAATRYFREPLAVDVSVGKSDAIYKAHSYHTKVPHLAIVPSILHYTDPGDIVLDGFAGSGMTGVAAQWCGVSGTNKLFSFIASVATQVRAAIHVGFPVDDAAGERQTNACEPTLGLSDAQQWDDAPGRMTRNGLGSLEIGAGKTRVDE